MFRRAKAKAAEDGQAFRQLVTEALQEKLARRPARLGRGAAPWMAGFGELRRLRHETARVQRVINETFEVIEAEDRG